jgi:hypothetical protein
MVPTRSPLLWGQRGRSPNGEVAETTLRTGAPSLGLTQRHCPTRVADFVESQVQTADVGAPVGERLCCRSICSVAFETTRKSFDLLSFDLPTAPSRSTTRAKRAIG